MDTFLGDFRFGLRMLARSPGVSATAIVALALGIGANTAIFSVVRTVLWSSLPVRDAHQLVTITHHSPARKMSFNQTAYVDVCNIRRQVTSFEAIAGYQQTSMSLQSGEEPERVLVGKVEAGFFPMLGVRPALGREFIPDEDRPGTGRAALLTAGLWRRRFAADSGVVGTTLNLDGDVYNIVGVLPEGFRFVGSRPDLYVPLAGIPARGGRQPSVVAYGRLKTGVTPHQVQAELDAADAAIDAAVPAHKDWKLRTSEISDYIVDDVRASLLALLGAVSLVLLVACANVASLLLSRATARLREMAVRAALGASRARLARQLLVEGLPLGLLGGTLGLLLAWWGVSLAPLIDLSRVPRLGETRIDPAVLLFTAGVSLATTILFGLAPALSLSLSDVHETLKEGGRAGAAGLRSSRLRSVLVACEVALALILSVGALLMIRTIHRLTAVNPGFRTESTLTASIELPRSRAESRESMLGFYKRLTDQLTALPGVESVCLTSSLPLGGNYFKGDFRVEGRDYVNPRDIPVLNLRIVDSAYFRTLGIALRKGRVFNEQDREGAPPVAVINETTARRLFPGDDPLGRRIGQPKDMMTIVGVVADVKHTDVSLGPDTEVLMPFAQRPSRAMTIAVKVDSGMYSDPMRFAPLLRRAVTTVDKNQAVHRVAAFDAIASDRLSTRRLSMILLGVFSGLAILLAAIGIYGVLSYSVERRSHEIGVRMALGADARDVVRVVVRQALLLTVAGVIAGIAVSLAAARLLSSLLYGVTPGDPSTLASAAILLLAVSAVASYLPARRAVHVDPIEALRHD